MISTVRNSSFGKVILESVKNFVHRGVGGVHPLWADTPTRQSFLGRPPPQQTPRPPRWPLQRTVRIILECILVTSWFDSKLFCTVCHCIELHTSSKLVKLPLRGYLFSGKKVNLININMTCLQIYFVYKLGGTSKGVTERNRVCSIRTIEGSSVAVKVEPIPPMTEV